MTSPVIQRELVEWLDRVFTDAVLPEDVSVCPREIDMRIGQRSVIEHIRREHVNQTNPRR